MSSKQSLKEAWAKLKEEQPKLRIKNAADELGVSEVELVSTMEGVSRLQENWEGLFKGFESFGYVMALTRNEHVVHEKKGEYHKISFNGHVGLVLDPKIDLRIFPKRFAFAFSVPVQTPRGEMLSIQFFNKYGTAVHKVYLMNQEHVDDYHAFVQEFRHEDQASDLVIDRGEMPADYKTREDVDKDAILKDWSELKDTHDFFPLLRKHKVARTHALQLGEGTFTQKMDNSVTERMLLKASEKQVPIMVFVSSGSVIQIHSGEVEKIKKMDNWLNVLDSEFNLHLKEDSIANTWIVEKPTEDGVVTSLEIFDTNNKNIATFFGARKPGKPELDGWKAILNDLKEEQIPA